jgi:hypothetical protein
LRLWLRRKTGNVFLLSHNPMDSQSGPPSCLSNRWLQSYDSESYSMESHLTSQYLNDQLSGEHAL